MRVHLVKKPTIDRYVIENARMKSSFHHWMDTLKTANWYSPLNIKENFRSADLLGNNSNRVVFDIGGNNVRMICEYAFGKKQVHLYICWIGSHAEYTQLCQRRAQYIISDY